MWARGRGVCQGEGTRGEARVRCGPAGLRARLPARGRGGVRGGRAAYGEALDLVDEHADERVVVLEDLLPGGRYREI